MCAIGFAEEPRAKNTNFLLFIFLTLMLEAIEVHRLDIVDELRELPTQLDLLGGLGRLSHRTLLLVAEAQGSPPGRSLLWGHLQLASCVCVCVCACVCACESVCVCVCVCVSISNSDNVHTYIN